MAKSKKQKGFSDPLDSVFNIIFSGAKSKPVRIKPRKVNGYSASKELAQGLAEIAANPANYLAGNTFGLVNEISNGINIAEFRYDKIDASFRKGDEDAGRIRIRAGELPNFLKDPNGYIDNIFEKAKAERAWGSYLQIGRGMDSAALTVWAKKQGFSNKEALSIGMAASNWVGADQVNEARKAFAQNVVYTALTGRANLASTDPKYISKDNVRALEKLLISNNADILSKNGELEKVLKSVPGLSSRSDFNDIVSEVRDVFKDKLASGYHPYSTGLKKGKDAKGNDIMVPHYSNYLTEGVLNRDGYLNMLRDNYSLRSNLYKDGNASDLEYAKTLAKAQNALEVLGRLKSGNWKGGDGGSFAGMNTRATYNKLSDQLKSLTAEIAKETNPAKKSDLIRIQKEFSSQLDSAKKRITLIDRALPWGSTLSGNFGRYKNALMTQLDYEIQKQKWRFDDETDPRKKMLYGVDLDLMMQKKDSLRTLSGVEWRILLADIQGTLNTMQSSRDILPNLLKGTFFVSDITGSLAPGEFNQIKMRKYLPKSKRDLDSSIALLVLPRGDIAEGYASLVNLYYLHPSSILKTLAFNGEGFGFLKYRQRLGVANQLNESGFAKNLFDVLSKTTSTDSDVKKLIENMFIQDGAGKAILDKTLFAQRFVDFADILEMEKAGFGTDWKKIESIIGRDQNDTLAKLFEAFGAPNRAYAKFKKYYDGVIQAKVNKFFVDNVVRRFFGQKVASSVMAYGFEKLALRQIISLAAQEWAAGIGAAVGGPLGAIAAAALVFLAEGFMERIAKPFIKFFAAMLWFIAVILIGVAAYFVTVIYSAFNPLPQQHIPPTDAIACVSDNPFAGSYQYASPVNAGNFKNAPADSTCPIIGEPKICTWGAGPGASAYHLSRKALDIGTRSISDPVWYAPTNGTISEYRAVNTNCKDGSNYGGSMKFTDDKGNVYTLIHVKGLASGKVSKGTPVAIAQGNDELNPGYCWTGPHFHLDVNSGGGYVNTETWYREVLKCNIVKGHPSCNG